MSNEEIKQLMRDEETKRVIKEAIREWLDEQFTRVGKWTFYGLLAGIIAGAAYLALLAGGWHK